MRTARQRLKLLSGTVSHDQATRFQARHALLSFVAKRLGSRLYEAYNTWFEDPEFLSQWSGSPWSAREAIDRKYTIFQLLRYQQLVPGDTAECGSYEGMSSYLILAATKGEDRTHHIFDSFMGLSSPTTEDTVGDPEVFRWQKHSLTAPEQLLRRNLAPFDNFLTYPGWIPERFDDVADANFSFVHVDVDLYEPTRDSFTFFYDRLVPGGVILCDDYGFSSCPGARRAVDEFGAWVDRPVLVFPTGQAAIWKL